MKKEPNKVWVTVSETINTGNYNSVKIEAGFSKDYDNEDPKELLNKGIDTVRELVKKKAKTIRKKETR